MHPHVMMRPKPQCAQRVGRRRIETNAKPAETGGERGPEVANLWGKPADAGKLKLRDGTRTTKGIERTRGAEAPMRGTL